MPKQDRFRAVIAPGKGRAKDAYYLAVESVGGQITIIAEFRHEDRLRQVVRALNGDYAHRLWTAEMAAE